MSSCYLLPRLLRMSTTSEGHLSRTWLLLSPSGGGEGGAIQKRPALHGAGLSSLWGQLRRHLLPERLVSQTSVPRRAFKLGEVQLSHEMPCAGRASAWATAPGERPLQVSTKSVALVRTRTISGSVEERRTRKNSWSGGGAETWKNAWWSNIYIYFYIYTPPFRFLKHR